MSDPAILVTYTLPGADPVVLRIDPSKHDPFDVCNQMRDKLFPDATGRAENDALADAILKRRKKARA